MKEAFISKKFQKLVKGKCKICGESRYELLDVHRIIPELGYNSKNTVVLCTMCHRLHHSNKIKIIFIISFLKNL